MWPGSPLSSPMAIVVSRPSTRLIPTPWTPMSSVKGGEAIDLVVTELTVVDSNGKCGESAIAVTKPEAVLDRCCPRLVVAESTPASCASAARRHRVGSVLDLTKGSGTPTSCDSKAQ